MSDEANMAIVRRFVDEVQSKHNLDLIDQLFTDDYVNHYAGSVQPGPEGAKQFFAMVFKAFPDLHGTIHAQTAEGDKVWTRKSFRGTHLGPFMGVPATGKPIAFDVIDVFRIKGGRIAEHWGVSDMLRLMQQIGPSPVTAASS